MNLVQVAQKLRSQIDIKGRLFFSRRRAHSIRQKLIKKRNRKVVDRRLKKTLKSYSKETFGSSSYWPWLALYTEIRGEFKPGWLPDDYYTVIFLDKYCPIDARISNYKTFDHRLFPGFAIEPVLIKISGRLFDSENRPLAVAEAQNILIDYDNEVVIKEDGGLGGQKVKFIDSNIINLKNLQEIPNFVIQPVIKQHKSLKALSPNAVSTLRIVTFMKENGDIDIKYTYLRFGMGESRVDNLSSGGAACYVDKNGNLTGLAYNKQGLTVGSEHPDTGFRFETLSIPNYEMILDYCKHSHLIFPYLRLIGWDITINEEAEPILLEWNVSPGIWLEEAMFGPCWIDVLFGKNQPLTVDKSTEKHAISSIRHKKRTHFEV